MNLSISKEDLYNDYVVQGMSQRDVAKKYNSSQTQIRRLMDFYEIPSRSSKEKTEYFHQKMKPIWDSYKETYKKYTTKTCEWCGKDFEIDCNSKSKKFCSDQCKKDHVRANREKYYCERCGNEIIYEDRVYKKKYCNECYEVVKKEPKLDRVITHCGYCGKELSVIKSRFNSNKFCYCNTDCMSKHYSEIYTGENSPTWTGGKRHYTGNWYSARRQVRARDKYICQRCGITEKDYGKELSVHHIKKYKSFENKNEANKLDNLVCLCEPCHRFVHSNQNVNKEWIKS